MENRSNENNEGKTLKIKDQLNITNSRLLFLGGKSGRSKKNRENTHTIIYSVYYVSLKSRLKCL